MAAAAVAFSLSWPFCLHQFRFVGHYRYRDVNSPPAEPQQQQQQTPLSANELNWASEIRSSSDDGKGREKDALWLIKTDFCLHLVIFAWREPRNCLFRDGGGSSS